MSINRDQDKLRDWKRRGAKRYRDKVKREVLSGERDWNSVPEVNRKRKKEREANPDVYGDYHDWIATLSCILAGLSDHECKGPVVGHHLKRTGNGGQDYANEVPVCVQAHEECHGSEAKVEERYELDLSLIAAGLAEHWELYGSHHKGEE